MRRWAVTRSTRAWRDRFTNTREVRQEAASRGNAKVEVGRGRLSATGRKRRPGVSKIGPPFFFRVKSFTAKGANPPRTMKSLTGKGAKGNDSSQMRPFIYVPSRLCGLACLAVRLYLIYP